MQHVMIDLETLGTKPGSVILSIGAAFFAFDGTVGETFYRNISSKSCVDRGLTVDPQTQAWWRRQSEAARNAVLVDRQSLDDVATEFSDLVHHVVERVVMRALAGQRFLIEAADRIDGAGVADVPEFPWRAAAGDDARGFPERRIE